MPENYQFERATVTLDGTTAVTAVPAPPFGVSYRIFHINALNTSGGVRFLFGRINSSVKGNFICFYATALNTLAYISTENTVALAEWPTIAVLDSPNETFEVYLNSTGTDVVSVCYEIVDQTGPRSFRNSLVLTDGTSQKPLIGAPGAETVHRVLNVNGWNNSGGSRYLSLTAGGGGRMAQLFTTNASIFRGHLAANQAPFPPFVLSSTSDNLIMTMNDTGVLNISSAYEVLDRRVV
jgi:hypothetical protein